MIFGSKDVGNFLRKFVNEFGVDFDDHVRCVDLTLFRIVKFGIVYTSIPIRRV
jgi:hypothetical protein